MSELFIPTMVVGLIISIAGLIFPTASKIEKLQETQKKIGRMYLDKLLELEQE